MTDPNARLGTRIPPPIARRLKLAAAVGNTTITALLTQVLDRELPTDSELAEQLKETATDGIFLGRAQFRRAARVPPEGPATLIGPPRTGKAGGPGRRGES